MTEITVVQKAIVFLKDKILVIRRSLDDHCHPGLWDFPGGKLEYGEDLLEGLGREIKEETGLDISEPKLICCFSVFEPEAKDHKFRIRMGYSAKAITNGVTLSDEHFESEWVESSKLRDLEMSPGNRRMVEEYLNRNITA